jgi:UPF0755 protein
MRKRQRLVIVTLLFVTLACGALGFGVWTVGVNIFQSAGPPDSPTINFVITGGENTAQIGDALQAQGLIRNSLAFRLWARYKGLDRRLQAGAYPVSASMTIPDIVDTFLSASPSEFWVTIPDGLRVWQIASKFAKTTELIKFKSDEFVQIAQTGNYTDPTTGKTVALASQYWFLNHDQQDNTAPNFALEGYLFPDTYLVPLDASAADTIKLMLNDFGEKLCRGPDNKPDAYLNDEQGCLAHPTIDAATHKSIFDLMNGNFGNLDSKSIADKLFHVLTIASIVQREAYAPADFQGIAAVYYKRYRVSTGEYTGPHDVGNSLQSDPTVSYAIGTPDNPWPELNDAGVNYTDAGPYNTYLTQGLPPGPICSPSLLATQATINPPNTPYFYFYGTKDGKIIYAQTYEEQQQNIQKYGG